MYFSRQNAKAVASYCPADSVDIRSMNMTSSAKSMFTDKTKSNEIVNVPLNGSGSMVANNSSAAQIESAHMDRFTQNSTSQIIGPIIPSFIKERLEPGVSDAVSHQETVRNIEKDNTWMIIIIFVACVLFAAAVGVFIYKRKTKQSENASPNEALSIPSK